MKKPLVIVPAGEVVSRRDAKAHSGAPSNNGGMKQAAPLGQAPPPRLTTRWGRGLYVSLGCGCLGLGFIGVFLPGLPTTPFVLLAAFFYARSSPRLHGWLRRSRLFGPLLDDWRRHRGIRLSVKLSAVAMVTLMVTLSVTVGNLPIWSRITIVMVAAIGVGVIVRIPTIKAAAEDGAPRG
jgi:uncharacterized membrane protein YbaN (DUF454 family)